MPKMIKLHGAKYKLSWFRRVIREARTKKWQKTLFKRLDAVIIHGDDEDSGYQLYCGQPYDPKIDEFIPGGWEHDHCDICGWVIMESDDTSHSIAYRCEYDWLCQECYKQFIPSR